MVMRALDRKLLRDLARMKTQAVAIALVVASGVALMLLHRWTVVAVLACWGAQAVYLLWAQRWHAPDGPIAFQGRRQSINAFALYSAVAALVLWMNTAGVLR